jgi:hypothetical protein
MVEERTYWDGKSAGKIRGGDGVQGEPRGVPSAQKKGRKSVRFKIHTKSIELGIQCGSTGATIALLVS